MRKSKATEGVGGKRFEGVWSRLKGTAQRTGMAGRVIPLLGPSLLAALLAAAPARAERPLFVLGAGAGIGVEPLRTVGSGAATTTARSTLGMMSFDGSILGEKFGFLFRLAGTLGAIDYQTTGFDRISFVFAGVLRPLGKDGAAASASYGQWVLSRLSLEVGPMYEWLLAGFTSGHAGGIHVGASVDLPLFSPREAAASNLLNRGDAGPFLRVSLSHPFMLTDTSVQATTGTGVVEAGSSVFRALISLCVGF